MKYKIYNDENILIAESDIEIDWSIQELLICLGYKIEEVK
jgi:hypothetical protein|tara:strand:+ start:199 stop:318 length:120 start_codon:yes stop_codon:yes gene_type:complete